MRLEVVPDVVVDDEETRRDLTRDVRVLRLPLVTSLITPSESCQYMCLCTQLLILRIRY